MDILSEQIENVPAIEPQSQPVTEESQNLHLDLVESTINEHDRSQDTDEIMAFNREPSLTDILLESSMTRPDAPKLFEDNNDNGEIGESQLMALCSGTFATQAPDVVNMAYFHLSQIYLNLTIITI